MKFLNVGNNVFLTIVFLEPQDEDSSSTIWLTMILDTEAVHLCLDEASD